MPMRDGVRLATDIYRPKNAPGKVPIVFVRTPYNFNFWDVRNGVPADMTAALTAVKRGYAYVVQNERGHFFSEGNYDILGAPTTDGYDTDRLAVEAAVVERQGRHDRLLVDRRVSDGASRRSAIRRYAAMNVQGFGAGVGRVGAVLRAGQLVSRRRRADAVHRLALRRAEPGAADVPAETRRSEDLIRASKAFDLAPQHAAGRLVEGAVAPAGAGHHQERRRPARHLRRRDAGARPADA